MSKLASPRLQPVTDRLRPFVPRLAVDWLRDTPSVRTQAVEGTLVFADVSGFTELTESLARRGREGAEEITGVLDTAFAHLTGAAYAYDADLVTLAKNSDVLMIVTPGGAGTSKLVNARVLDALGPQGYVVIVARGTVVDELVLLKYLQEKKIAGAGLDVFEHEPKVPAEFYSLDNAVLFPHVASATVETRKAMGDLQVENLHLHFAGKPVKTPISA